MAIVSISKAARLTGKARSTIQSYIKTGKLSRTTGGDGGQGIDVSELIRVFGSIKDMPEIHVANELTSQQTTSNTTGVNVEIATLKGEINSLKREAELLKEIINEKDEHNQSLKQAMLLLENKQENQGEKPKKKWWQFS